MASILCGILAGMLTSLSSIFVMALLFGLSHEEYVTLLPKSVTTAIGMGISEELGGYVTITTVVIILTGVFGNITAEGICRLLKIQNSISRGLAIGAASHVIGTSKAMEMGETEGAMSSLAVVVSGMCTVVGAVLFLNFINALKILSIRKRSFLNYLLGIIQGIILKIGYLTQRQ